MDTPPPSRPKQRHYTAEVIASAVLAYKAGESQASIMSRIGCAKGTLREWIAKAEAEDPATLASIRILHSVPPTSAPDDPEDADHTNLAPEPAFATYGEWATYLADKLKRVAGQAADRLAIAMAEEKTRDLKPYAETLAVALRSAQLLSGQATERTETTAPDLSTFYAELDTMHERATPAVPAPEQEAVPDGDVAQGQAGVATG